jgi:hypothetical protein
MQGKEAEMQVSRQLPCLSLLFFPARELAGYGRKLLLLLLEADGRGKKKMIPEEEEEEEEEEEDDDEDDDEDEDEEYMGLFVRYEYVHTCVYTYHWTGVSSYTYNAHATYFKSI